MARKLSIRKIKRYFRRTFTKRNAFLVATLGLVFIVFWVTMQPSKNIPAAAYTPLLEVIAKAESRGNYNAYFGNAANQQLKFTDMPIADVLEWQKRYVEAGNASSAVGRYQIISPTLVSLVKQLNINTSEKYDKAMQNRLAIALMERRGSINFVKEELSAEAFAHELSKEWAALPKVIGDSPETSFYADDGLNRSLVDSKTSLMAVQQFKRLANMIK
jgi:conjugal transfer mating pair stabilization protein TraG